jgi:hypothetical protein
MMRMRSTFHERALLGDFAVPHPEDIHAEHVPLQAARIQPSVAPGYTGALTTGEGIAKIKGGRGGILEESLKANPDGCLTNETLTVWRRESVLKNTILGHEGYDIVHGMPVESRIEALDDLEGRGAVWLCG